ncbi:MAG: hypothetical protein Q4D05_00240 [Acinetobacter sp.]|nr:hypothetical protein [Acinetobacter sp.]
MGFFGNLFKGIRSATTHSFERTMSARWEQIRTIYDVKKLERMIAEKGLHDGTSKLCFIKIYKLRGYYAMSSSIRDAIYEAGVDKTTKEVIDPLLAFLKYDWFLNSSDSNIREIREILRDLKKDHQ